MAEQAFDAVRRQLNEAWSAASALVVKHFRASFANAHRPCESQFFWRYVTEGDLRLLFNRLADALMPNPFDRNGMAGVLLAHTQRIAGAMLAGAMRPLRLVWHDPYREAMFTRGVVTHGLFKTLSEVLSAQSVSCKLAAAKLGSEQVRDNMFSLQELSQLFISNARLRE